MNLQKSLDIPAAAWFINGEFDAWDELVALNPCLRYGGVEMQCFDSDGSPAIVLSGAPSP